MRLLIGSDRVTLLLVFRAQSTQTCTGTKKNLFPVSQLCIATPDSEYDDSRRLDRPVATTTLVVSHDHVPSDGLVLGGKLLLVEPESDLLGSRFMRVRSVDDVAADRDTKVTSNGARVGILGVGGTHEATTLADDVLALPHHGNDGSAAGDVSDEASIEGLLGKVDVVLLCQLLRGDDCLKCHKLVTTFFKAGDDLADDLARDTVGLDHDVRLLSGGTELASDSGGSFEVDRRSGKGRVGQGTSGRKGGSAHVAASRGIASTCSLGGECARSDAESGDSRSSKHDVVVGGWCLVKGSKPALSFLLKRKVDRRFFSLLAGFPSIGHRAIFG